MWGGQAGRGKWEKAVVGCRHRRKAGAEADHLGHTKNRVGSKHSQIQRFGSVPGFKFNIKSKNTKSISEFRIIEYRSFPILGASLKPLYSII